MGSWWMSYTLSRPRDLVDVLVTSTGARRQPMVVFITTAGFDRESVCWEYHDYARKVLDGVIIDDTFFAYIAGAEKDDDWQDPAIWQKANPGLGVTVKVDYLETEAKRAAQIPAYQNTFRRLHLNQWTQQETRWMPIDKWEECSQEVNSRLLQGAECYGGLDLASTTDIASLVLDFPNENGEDERHIWLAWFWVPEESIMLRARKDKVSYDAWARDGFIKATPGSVIDYATIAKDIEALWRHLPN